MRHCGAGSYFDDLDKLVESGEVCGVPSDDRQVVGQSDRGDVEDGEASPLSAAVCSDGCADPADDSGRIMRALDALGLGRNPRWS